MRGQLHRQGLRPAHLRAAPPRLRRAPWTFDLGASLTYQRSFGGADLRVKLAVYNLLNQQRALEVDDSYETGVGVVNEFYRLGTGYQTPRYAQLTVSVDF